MNSTARLPFWGVSLLVVIGLHAALFFWALFWHAKAVPLELPPAAMMIELEPLAALPKPVPPPTPVVKPVEPEPQPKIIEAPKPKIVIAKPKPRPKPKPQEPKPEVKPEPTPPQDVPTVAKDEKAAAPQQAPVSAPTQAQVSWQSKLLGHLAKYKRYPEDARRRGLEGVNRLRFVLDANGKVLSFSLVGRSGSASLDRATLEMIRRAQPLPAPPADMLQNGELEIVAPFVYSLDRR
ncbi:energy transducer TonB [Aquipseudomonas ullengensis]|uniref:Protein TonB n=1 Tax=Aquipseudomonas ullengensis TaxID=2759166 RepID=A0A7W4LJ30_9GAMM|nr:energy transducer TonB [Pseudomonas ullengensis]MBB2494108.1 energy transducer TonB [Pseudomonas ullengensis]